MKTHRCAGEETLILLVDAAGLDEIRIMQTADDVYLLSLKLKTNSEWIFLATRRQLAEPRQFRKIEAAVSVGQRKFAARRFTLLMV